MILMNNFTVVSALKNEVRSAYKQTKNDKKAIGTLPDVKQKYSGKF